VHLGSAHSRALACSAKRLGFLNVLAQPRKLGREIPPPPLDAGGSPTIFDRPAVVGRWGNSLGVALGDGGFDLG
jgi:hypothetical protein